MKNSESTEKALSELRRELEKYQNFVNDLTAVTSFYEGQFPELVQKIRELRILQSEVKSEKKTVALEINPYEVSATEDLGTRQLLKKSWRSAARLTHPDHGGNSELFMYARTLYESGDLTALNLLLESLHKGDFTIYVAEMKKKLHALYEVKRATLAYQLLTLHRAGRTEEAKSLMRQTLESIAVSLSTNVPQNFKNRVKSFLSKIFHKKE